MSSREVNHAVPAEPDRGEPNRMTTGPLPPLRAAVDELSIGVALAVGLFLYLQRPSVRRRTVLAALPWLAVGVALHALRGIVAYPDAARAVLGIPWVYLLAATLAGLARLIVGEVVGSGARSLRPYYIGVAGIGALLPPATALIARAGTVAPERLAVWLLVPVMAGAATGLLMIGLGLWLPELRYFAGGTGAAVLFGLTLDGIGTALAFGFGTRIGAPVGLLPGADAVLPVPAGTPLPVPAGTPLAVASALVWLRLAVGIGALGLLTALAGRRPAAAERGLELATVVSVVVAANTFLFALGRGIA